jgi:thiamine kinase-like enzyme
LVKDKKDDKTSIGKYNKKLKLAQQKVNLVKQEMNNFSELSEIKSVIKKIDIEISKRK